MIVYKGRLLIKSSNPKSKLVLSRLVITCHLRPFWLQTLVAINAFPQASLSWPQPLQQTQNVFVLASPTHWSSAGKLPQETWLVTTQNIRCAQPTKTLLAAATARIDGRTAAATAATSWRHYARQMRPTKFPRSCPIRTALTFQCRVIADIKGIICCKLKIINECTSFSYMPWT